jgi:hypothetical protein
MKALGKQRGNSGADDRKQWCMRCYVHVKEKTLTVLLRLLECPRGVGVKLRNADGEKRPALFAHILSGLSRAHFPQPESVFGRLCSSRVVAVAIRFVVRSRCSWQRGAASHSVSSL